MELFMDYKQLRKVHLLVVILIEQSFMVCVNRDIYLSLHQFQSPLTPIYLKTIARFCS